MDVYSGVLFLYLVALQFLCGFSLTVQFAKHKASYNGSQGAGDDPGQPLYLTPLIKEGQIQKGAVHS